MEKEEEILIPPYGEDGDDATPRWMLPGNHRSADDQVSPRPETVLLDTEAYIDDKTNATTAYGKRSDDKSEIQVTFWIAQPPSVSYYTVHCKGLEPDAFPQLPEIVATEDDIALLRIPVFPEHKLGDDRINEFFIYRAGTGKQKPLLRQIPNPDPRYYADKEVGILNCPTDGKFFIVVLHRDLFTDPVTRYIHKFDSGTWKWHTNLVSPPDGYSYYITDKVFTIGGRYGSIAWVDLWRGIFIYDVILGGDTISYVPLPSSGLPTLQGMACTVRDIIAVNGCIKYFCMYSPGTNTTRIKGDWLAYAWRMKYHSQQDWKLDWSFKASEIRMDKLKGSGLRQAMPDLMLRAGSPVLSLHDDDVVYILTKPMYIDNMACFHAINMSKKTVQGIAEVRSERTFGFMPTYTQSGIFKPKGIEVEKDDEEADWIPVSNKKNGGPKNGGAPSGSWQRMPTQRGMHTGMRQRQHQMERVSGISVVGGRGRVAGRGQAHGDR